jgi:isoleucyl-tRNA synthetase
MGTVLSDEPPFLNLFGYATLLAEDGREMHKSWGNSIEFNEAAEQDGRGHDALALCQLQAGAKPALRLPRAVTRRAAAS